MMPPMTDKIYNLYDFNAKGDGIADDSGAWQACVSAAALFSGTVMVPPGRFLVNGAILDRAFGRVAIDGLGANVSVLVSRAGGTILTASFLQSGLTQPFGLSIQNVGFASAGPCAAPVVVSYVNPDGSPVTATNELWRPSTTFRNVQITSHVNGWFVSGPQFTGCWGITMSDVYISGKPINGQWDNLSGAGLSLRGMCVNSRFVNCQFNFWATGVDVEGNTEGLHFSNCSAIAVKRGVWIRGDIANYPSRMSSFTWQGGIIELRVGGVTTGSAAFHLVYVNTALISAMQAVTESIAPGAGLSYAFFVDSCNGVVISGCDVNSFQRGLNTTGQCASINSHGQTFSNCHEQTVFNVGTRNSRSYGHSLFNNEPLEINLATPESANRIGFVN